jgi:hypothetical protein
VKDYGPQKNYFTPAFTADGTLLKAFSTYGVILVQSGYISPKLKSSGILPTFQAAATGSNSPTISPPASGLIYV